MCEVNVSASASLDEGLMFPSLRKLEPVKARLCVDAVVAPSLLTQPLFSIPVCQTLPALTGLL